jgi:hypothetical protein
MATEYTVQVHFLNGTERIVPAINIHTIDEEGTRSATALVDGQEVPIYNRPEWDILWFEQEQHKTDEKLPDIQEGDEVGYYGSIKADGSREKLHGIVLQTVEPTKLRVSSGKFPGLPVTIEIADVFERSRVIHGEGTSTRVFEGSESEA